MDVSIQSDEIAIVVSTELYSESVLYKCFYWYGGEYSVTMSPLTNNYMQIRLRSLVGDKTNSDLEEVIEKIRRDLIDFKLREIVSIETKNIRDLLIAKAFSISEVDEMPPGSVSDPVGFNP